MNYAENIYELRKKNDVTQDALAVALGTTRQTVSRWECGTVVPSMKNINAMAEYFNVSVEEVLGTSVDVKEEDIKENIIIKDKD